jgi:hypothetical protein
MILEEVKDKKEFRFLSDDFVSRVLAQYNLKYNPYIEKQKKKLIKEARAKLRELYSAFRLKGYDKREKYLEGMKTFDDIENCKKILSLHLSSKERLNYYPKLYKKLRNKFQFKTVLDIGCGMNVFSRFWMGAVDYYGVDVNKEDVDFCNKYLEKFKLTGGVRWGDVLGFDTLVKTDVCFLFKLLEGLESLDRGATEKLLRKITSSWVVVSFATKSLGGGKVISAKRLKWFEKLVKVEEKFILGSEVYYIIRNV